MKQKLPVIVRVYLENQGFDMDAVDAEIYCVNNTPYTFFISTKSESFTTIDEDSGLTAEHGSDPLVKKLLSGEYYKIAEVKGWEWDGHVGIEVAFVQEKSENMVLKSYDFKTGKSNFSVAPDKKGRLISPEK